MNERIEWQWMNDWVEKEWMVKEIKWQWMNELINGNIMNERIEWQWMNDWVERVNWWKDKVTMFEWLSGKIELMKG